MKSFGRSEVGCWIELHQAARELRRTSLAGISSHSGRQALGGANEAQRISSHMWPVASSGVCVAAVAYGIHPHNPTFKQVERFASSLFVMRRTMSVFAIRNHRTSNKELQLCLFGSGYEARASQDDDAMFSCTLLSIQRVARCVLVALVRWELTVMKTSGRLERLKMRRA